MYAIVRSGGLQHKVAVGDVFDVNRVDGTVGDTLNLPAVLVVDGETVTHEAAALARVQVTAEVVEHRKGPKIRIHLYRNKTGYHRRQGHRQSLTRLRVTGIDSGK